MPDDLSRRQPEDPRKVNLDQPHEVRWWCEEWSITEEKLRRLVERYGPMVVDIKDGMLAEGFEASSR